MNYKKTIWFLVDHPWQLFLALSLKKYEPSTYSYGLLISRHEYWKKMDINRYQNLFQHIYFFDEPSRVHSLSQIPAFFKTAKKIRSELKTVPIQPTDPLITLSYFKYTENIIASLLPNKNIFICRHDMYQNSHESLLHILASSHRHVSKSGFLHYFVLDPLLHLKKKVLSYWVSEKEFYHHTVYTRPLKKLYNRVFVLRSVFTPLPDSNSIYYPYALLTPETTIERPRKKIIYILSDFVKNEGYYEKISTILQNLRVQYSSQYELVLRRHPNNLDEYKKVDSFGWELDTQLCPHEQYMIDNYQEIELVVSHVSTALNFSLSVGLPSFSYHRAFSFSKTFQGVFDTLFEGAPQAFFASSLEETPKAPFIKTSFTDPVKESLKKIYEYIEA